WPIEVPGLDARRDDIPELIEHFVAEICQRHRFPPIAVSRRALVACRYHPWPGHTRQLSRAIEAAVIRAHSAKSQTLEERHVFPTREPNPEAQTLWQATREFQKRFVGVALDRNDWNVSETARELDLARSHLYNLIRDFGLRDPDKDK